MSGSASNIKITITAANLANATIANLNKQVTGLQQPVNTVGRGLMQLGNTAGVNRAAQAMGTFGNQTLASARAMERLVTPLGIITAAGSVAGIAALTKNWADAGVSIKNAAYTLDMPASKLWTLQKAAKMAGGDITSSLEGIQKSIEDVYFNAPGAKTGLFKEFQLGVADAKTGLQRTVEDALPDYIGIMDKRFGQGNVRAKLKFWLDIGGKEEGFPLARELKIYNEMMERATRSGGSPTEKMIKDASELKKSWEELTGAVEGVTNTIMSRWSGTATSVIDSMSRMLEKDNELGAHWSEAGAIGFSGLSTAALIAKSFGPTGLVATGAPLAVVGGAVAAGVTGAKSATAIEAAGARGYRVRQVDDFGNPITFYNPSTHDELPASDFLPGGPKAGAGALPGPRATPTPSPANPLLGPLPGVVPPGAIPPGSAAGLLLGPQASAGSGEGTIAGYGNPAAAGWEAANLTTIQMGGRTVKVNKQAAAAFEGFGKDLAAAGYQINSLGGHNLRAVTGGTGLSQHAFGLAVDINPGKNPYSKNASGGTLQTDMPANVSEMARKWGLVWGGDWNSLKDPMHFEYHGGAGGGPRQFAQSGVIPDAPASGGGVHVTVDIKGAPHGTTAHAAASGAATTAPPRVEVPMPSSR